MMVQPLKDSGFVFGVVGVISGLFCVLYAQYRPDKIMFITPKQYMGLGIIMICLGALLLFLSDLTSR
jgi:hypothetical protein